MGLCVRSCCAFWLAGSGIRRGSYGWFVAHRRWDFARAPGPLPRPRPWLAGLGTTLEELGDPLRLRRHLRTTVQVGEPGAALVAKWSRHTRQAFTCSFSPYSWSRMQLPAARWHLCLSLSLTAPLSSGTFIATPILLHRPHQHIAAVCCKNRRFGKGCVMSFFA